MSEAAPAEKRDEVLSKRRSDRKLLVTFAALLGISAAGSITFSSYSEGAGIADVVSAILGGATLSLLIVGVPSYLRNRGNSLEPRRRILKWVVFTSAVLTSLAMVAISLAALYTPDLFGLDAVSTGMVVLVGAVLVILLFLVFMIALMVAFMVAFGAIGVMAAALRLFLPGVLRQVAGLSGSSRPSLTDRAVGWAFDIPEVVDTSTLSLRPTEPRRRVSFHDLMAPVLWQLLFGFVLGIYISFSPFISDRSPAALLSLFSLLTVASVLFPFMVLPWFLFNRLGADIKGHVKPFTLYKGIRSRLFQSYFAIGTIVLLLRVSIREVAVAMDTYLAGFSIFMASLLGSSLLATFVYLNYFENGLAEDVVRELRGTEVSIVDGCGMTEPADAPRQECSS